MQEQRFLRSNFLPHNADALKWSSTEPAQCALSSKPCDGADVSRNCVAVQVIQKDNRPGATAMYIISAW